MSVDTASVGAPVAPDVANQAPILDVAAPTLGPALNYTPVEGLPSELQPQPGDILLSRAFWPWDDLGAKGIPESWLYMSRHVQGTIAMLSVQTSAGPKLVKANPDGTIVQAVAPQSTFTPNFATDNFGSFTYLQRQYAKLQALKGAALGAASTTQLTAINPISQTAMLKKIVISSNVAVTNKVEVIQNGIAFLSFILPANAQPFVYEFPDVGSKDSGIGLDLYFYTDNAGIFSVHITYTSL